MDQHRDLLASDGQADKAQLHDSLDGLHRLIGRLSAMGPEYQELIRGAQRNLQDAYVLQREINDFVISQDLSLIPRRDLEQESTGTANEPPNTKAEV